VKARWWGGLALAALAAVGAAAAFLPLSPRRAGGIPTLVLARGPFSVTVPAEGVLEAVRATPLTVPPDAPQPARIAWLAPDGSAVEAGQVVIRLDPTDLEKERDDAATELASARLQEERQESTSEATLDNLERDAEVARLEEEIAHRFATRDAEVYSRKQILDSELDAGLAARRRRHAEEARRSEGEQAAAEAALLAIAGSKARRTLERAEEGLRALEVRAPHAGIFVLARDRRGEEPRVGDTVWPGLPLAEIPALGELQAEVYVLETDAGALAPGKAARVVVEAHPGESFPATVQRVDSLPRRRLRASPVQYFAVVLRLAGKAPGEGLRPGQRVRAELSLAEVPDALAVPRQAIFERDGRQVVFRRRGGGFEPVAVTLGPGSAGRVVVSGELAAGDVIALADPTGAPRPAAGGAGGPASSASPGVAGGEGGTAAAGPG
jgi:HlyD family secretion protein